MQAFLNKDKICVRARYEDKEIVKALGDYKWNKEFKAWEFPLRKLPKLAEYLNLTYNKDVEEALNKEKIRVAERQELINIAKNVKNKSSYATTAYEELKIQEIPVDLYTDLFVHQKQALTIASLFDSYALFMETGTGKTLVAIRLIQFRKVPTLIVCPLSVIESVWVSELEKWAPNLKYINLWDVYRKRNNILSLLHNVKISAKSDEPVNMSYEHLHDVYLINFESFKKIENPETYFKFIIIDESSKMKSPKTQITKKLVKLRNLIPYRLIMSGLPAPNNLLEYWGQLAFINDELLGDNYYRFRNTYFTSVGYGGFLYVPKSGVKDRIMSSVKEQAFFVKKTDCLDLPDRISEIRNIELDDNQKQIYYDMKKLNILEFKRHTTLAPNELAKIMKLRQITAGFTITTEGLAVKVSDNKLKVLKEFIEDELPEDQQAIIWCQFHWEITAILEMLDGRSAALYGELPQKVKDENIKAFQDGKVRFLVAHPKSGGMGLTFTNCSYMIWFSLSYSQEEHSQANDRIYRIGQVNKCTYIYILAKKTIDEVIYKALLKKKNMAEACLEMLK